MIKYFRTTTPKPWRNTYALVTSDFSKCKYIVYMKKESFTILYVKDTQTGIWRKSQRNGVAVPYEESSGDWKFMPFSKKEMFMELL